MSTWRTDPHAAVTIHGMTTGWCYKWDGLHTVEVYAGTLVLDKFSVYDDDGVAPTLDEVCAVIRDWDKALTVNIADGVIDKARLAHNVTLAKRTGPAPLVVEGCFC